MAGGGESRKIKDQTGKVLMAMVDSLDAQDRHTPILHTQVVYQGKDTSKKQSKSKKHYEMKMQVVEGHRMKDTHAPKGFAKGSPSSLRKVSVKQ